MVNRFVQILQMIRFSHTVFALPFALLAAVMAWRTALPGSDTSGVLAPFRWRDLVGIVFCMVFARSAAMAFNRIVDRRIDAQNPRTENRHLATGALSVGNVVLFTIGSSVGFILATLIFSPNYLPFYFSVPVLLFLLGYSYTKRFTALAHFWLGAALMLAPISAWVAIRGEAVMSDMLDVVPAAILGLAVLLWVSGFDIIYACQDVDFDKRVKLHSVPAVLGVPGALRLAALCHFAMVGTLALLPLLGGHAGPQLGLGSIFWIGLASLAGILVYEHSLVRADDLSRVNVAFFNANAVISVGLFVVVSVDLLI